MRRAKLTRVAKQDAGDFGCCWCAVCDEELGGSVAEPYADFGKGAVFRVTCVYCATHTARVRFYVDDGDPHLLDGDTVEQLLADGLRHHRLKDH
jgi:hypothetical protein